MKKLSFLLFSINSLLLAEVPFPGNLNAANIELSNISNKNTHSFFVGNGDIHGLIYSEGNIIKLRVSKNDAWDARVITANDPALPVVNVLTKQKTGSSGAPPSYGGTSGTEGPSPIVLCDLNIGQISGTVSATLNLQKAVAEISSSWGSVKVRALAQSNVFLIESNHTITMSSLMNTLPWTPTLPNANITEENGETWFYHQVPGDLDLGATDFHVGRLTKGNTTIVTVGTSRDSTKGSKTTIRQMGLDALNKEVSELVNEHEQIWNSYWSRSGISLNDKFYEKLWYRMLYLFRSFTKPGAQATGLYVGWGEVPKWHGDYHTNYNMWQTYWPAFVTNQPDQIKPMIKMLYRYHPRAKFNAQTNWGTEGATFGISIYPWETDPNTSNSKNNRSTFMHPWSFTIGLVGHTAQIGWLHYQYTQDTSYLRDTTYVLFKDYATFYASYIEQCHQRDSKTPVDLGPSYDPEHDPWGINNSPYDIAFTKYTLEAAIKASEILGVDVALRNRWQAALDKVPYYELNGAGTVVKNNSGTAVTSFNIPTPTVPIFPGMDISYYSPENEKTLFKNTLNWMKGRTTQGNWSNALSVMTPVAHARLSDGTAFSSSKSYLNPLIQANGYMDLFGYFCTEQVGVAGLIGELMLQSNEGILRLFPAWPLDEPAEFQDLLTEGAFEVSSKLADGDVQWIKVRAKKGGRLRLVSPWSTIQVGRVGSPIQDLTPGTHNIVEMDTKAGEELWFAKENPPVSVIARSKTRGVPKKVVGNIIRLPNDGNLRRIQVFDLSGNLVYETITNKNKIKLNELTNFNSINFSRVELISR